MDDLGALPSISRVEAIIDHVIDTSMDTMLAPIFRCEDDPDLNTSAPYLEQRTKVEQMSEDVLRGKICSVFGTDGAKTNNPIFTTLDELEGLFQASVVQAETPSGPTPEFISKIWSISDKQVEGAVEQNTHLNCQSSDGLLS